MNRFDWIMEYWSCLVVWYILCCSFFGCVGVIGVVSMLLFLLILWVSV